MLSAAQADNSFKTLSLPFTPHLLSSSVANALQRKTAQHVRKFLTSKLSPLLSVVAFCGTCGCAYSWETNH